MNSDLNCFYTNNSECSRSEVVYVCKYKPLSAGRIDIIIQCSYDRNGIDKRVVSSHTKIQVGEVTRQLCLNYSIFMLSLSHESNKIYDLDSDCNNLTDEIRINTTTPMMNGIAKNKFNFNMFFMSMFIFIVLHIK